jgi:nucleoside-diphosphate-sugar epimerase
VGLVPEIIAKMREVAPPRQGVLDDETIRLLQDLTQSLIVAKGGAAEEHARFLSIAERGLCLPEDRLAERLRGATVMVTGGTGCIGSALMGQLIVRGPSGPGRLVSVSRQISDSRPRYASAEYLRADVTDRASLDRVIGEVRPDLIFHVAAQRDPGLAEVEVHRTVSTNVLGARNVLAAAAEAGVPQVVCASTGKALRPFSPDMYTASKRAAEWVSSGVATSTGMLVSAARFTHVLDNSIIYQRLREWADDGVIRLHSPDIAFYVQSALESAQLLLLSCLGAERGEFRIFAISDLGWPVSLMDLALAVLASSGSRTPIYLSGYDKGYEEVPFPGLYDPLTAGDVSPLLNAFEASAVVDQPCPMVDAFRVDMAPEPRAVKLLSALAEVCDLTQDPCTVRATLNELSWAMLDATLRAATPQALMRSAVMAQRHVGTLCADHRRILDAIQDTAGPIAAQ